MRLTHCGVIGVSRKKCLPVNPNSRNAAARGAQISERSRSVARRSLLGSETGLRLTYVDENREQTDPLPVMDGRGASILGPRNIPLERENPSLLASPKTDSGTIPNLKFSFAAARNRLLTGGWAREVTVRELPIATELAAVNMRLKPGGIRELHWHKEAEWAFMLAGRARITAVDQDGRNFIADVGEGDLWNFPAGIPHSIQGLEAGCEFLLVFDDGNFSENETFLITDWFVHTPRDVLAKNFGVPQSAFDRIPIDVDTERYIFAGEVPQPLAADAVRSPAGAVPQKFVHHLLAQEPIAAPGGTARIADSSNFPAASTIAAAYVEVEPGAMRELHWHPNTDEWQYYISGQARMTVFASSGKARTFDYQAGDVGYIPFAMGHYVENTGNEPLRFLELFRSDRFADVSLQQWMALTPPELVAAHLNIDRATVEALAKEKQIVVAARVAHAQLDALPHWSERALSVLSTTDGGPHSIPVGTIVRAGDRRILFALNHARGSLARLRSAPHVALAVLDDELAFTASGTARVVQESIPREPGFAAVELQVDSIDDHRPGAPAVGVELVDEGGLHSLRDGIAALRELV
jgi:oxalate decarboxylase